ncbi:MAG TPA: flagellar basal body rod C-terminal domain-containing protein, partial [Caulobacteraceae bacterium]
AGVRASRADGFRLRTDIQASPSKLGLAQLDITAAVGAQGLAVGDGRGALALADAGARTATFAAAGGSSGGQLSISRYTAELAGDIGGRAAAAADRRDAAETLYTEAKSRQQGQEGVNLDEELVKLTTYQQAFNASARLIQSAKDMYDVLLGMI